MIKNSETPVTSSVVNLALFVNKQLALTGTWNATSKPPALNVTSVIEVLESMSATGSASLGGRLRFTTDGAPNDVTAQAIALKPGFFPILGTAMTLDYATLLVIGAGTLDGSGEFKTEVPIPNSASLVGLHLLSEALIVPANNSAIYSTNPRLSVVVP